VLKQKHVHTPTRTSVLAGTNTTLIFHVSKHSVGVLPMNQFTAIHWQAQYCARLCSINIL